MQALKTINKAIKKTLTNTIAKLKTSKQIIENYSNTNYKPLSKQCKPLTTVNKAIQKQLKHD